AIFPRFSLSSRRAFCEAPKREETGFTLLSVSGQSTQERQDNRMALH
ncbi:hypothetical protein CSUI_009277, partial [Cystoisospora suis]